MALVIDGVPVDNPDSMKRIWNISQRCCGHIHWRGLNAAPTATVWWDNLLTPFTAISGNNEYGADANDEANTPIHADSTHFTLKHMVIHTHSTTTAWKIQFVYGTGTMQEGIAAHQISSMMTVASAGQPHAQTGSAHPVELPWLPVTTKVWARFCNATNDATITFTISVDERTEIPSY